MCQTCSDASLGGLLREKLAGAIMEAFYPSGLPSETVGWATENHGLRENFCDQLDKVIARPRNSPLTHEIHPFLQDATSSSCNLNLFPNWCLYHLTSATLQMASLYFSHRKVYNPTTFIFHSYTRATEHFQTKIAL